MGKKIERFEDLDLWNEAVDIGVEIYKLTSSAKLERDYSSKDQLRRAAISISNNIAEGFEYNSNRSFIKFLKYSKGSAGELRSNLIVLMRAGLVSESDYKMLETKLLSMSKNIGGFIKYLKEFEDRKSKIQS